MKRKLLAGCAAAALMATPVLAQTPPPMFNWSGFYGGFNLGYSWGHGPLTYNEPAFSTIPAPTSLSSPSNLNGAIGGGQIGFNWQPSAAWVAGFEADIQAADETASRSYRFPIDSEGIPVGALTGTLSSRIDWFGTVRARAGWLVTPATLVYATGGFAYGQVSAAGSFSDTAPAATWSFNQSAINTGWTVGGGIEAAVANNVTFRIEYLYLDLGSLSGQGFDQFGHPYFYNATFTDNILRAGLNFKVP